MRRRVISAVFALVACLWSAEAAAQKRAGLTICNRDDRLYAIAVIVRIPVFLNKMRWESMGWYHIKPGECRTWNYGRVNTLFHLSVTRETNDGRRVLDYGVDDTPEWHWDSGAYGMQDFFCVSDEPYTRKADDKSAFRRCRGDEYLQLFNLNVFVEHNSDYTLDLK